MGKPVRVVGPCDLADERDLVVYTTSKSKAWSRGLSPFLLGPVYLYNGYISLNVENAWQYSKQYPGQSDEEWLAWARAGWASKRASRYPMGRGAIPSWSRWKDKKLGYIEARKQIYIPLYTTAVVQSKAYSTLVDIYNSLQHTRLCLFDFDGFDYMLGERTLYDVMVDPSRPMGHAFVLAMLLEGHIRLEGNEVYLFGELVYKR